MEGRIYITGLGADPGLGHSLTDPTFGNIPTLGACMPNIRRAVNVGDYIFVVSGKNAGVQQFVIGGFRVIEKIPMLQAFDRFPTHRLHEEAGTIKGNIIINSDGSKHKLDHHNDDRRSFLRRIENYIIGGNQIVMTNEIEIAKCRKQTLPTLSRILNKSGNRVIDITGRHCKLSHQQTQEIIVWLESIKEVTK